jgi:hypothetical protein
VPLPGFKPGELRMAIYRLLKTGVFDPPAIECMTAAYEDALRTLQLADRQDSITELVAKKIIEAAQLGENDPARLCKRALEDLGVTPKPSSEAGKTTRPPTPAG